MPLVKDGIRELSLSEIPQIEALEKDCFVHPYSASVYRTILRKNRFRTLVMVEYNTILGYCLYELKKNGTGCRELVIVRFAVAPDSRRRGVGRRLLDAMKKKADVSHHRIVVLVYDDELWAQLFFKACDFYCDRIVKDDSTDQYHFVYPHD